MFLNMFTPEDSSLKNVDVVFLAAFLAVAVVAFADVIAAVVVILGVDDALPFIFLDTLLVKRSD